MKTKSNKNLPKIFLVISLVLIILGSLIAWWFHTSANNVSIERISFETSAGTLSGLLYLPKDASEEAKPTIITTHGYLNSAEMQDATAIEMSRRGYVVLALDMYDHGHSSGNAENTGAFFSFWPTAMYDAVNYMYSQDYVLKDEEGNGIIAVSGHSMGGFSSEMALYSDELNYAQTGYRMIRAGLTVGADYSWTSYLGLDETVAASMFGGRTIGKIASQYDEFFFGSDEAPVASGTVYKKDYVATAAARILLENENPQANTYYECSDGGTRVIYEPSEIHPWNHFSKTSTGNAIEFYSVAFEGYEPAAASQLESSNQTWMFKELFEFVALIGLIMFIPAFITLLLGMSIFASAKTEKASLLPVGSTIAEKTCNVLLLAFSILFPAIIFPSVYNEDATAETIKWIQYGGYIVIFTAVTALILAIKKNDSNKKTWIWGCITAIVSAILLIRLVSKNLFVTGKIFQAPSVNSIVNWALICACIGIILMVGVYLLGQRKEQGITLGQYGITASLKTVGISLLIAVITVVATYIFVFVVDGIFKTDFRIWIVAFKSFEWSSLVAAMKYVPFFFIYYFVSGVASIANTNTEKLQGVWGYVLAAAINMGGITIWMIWQYGTLFTTGVAAYPDQNLSGILLFALIPSLAIASCFAKYLFKKTNHVYLAAFLNTILLTIMTVANTTVYFQ